MAGRPSMKDLFAVLGARPAATRCVTIVGRVANRAGGSSAAANVGLAKSPGASVATVARRPASSMATRRSLWPPRPGCSSIARAAVSPLNFVASSYASRTFMSPRQLPGRRNVSERTTFFGLLGLISAILGAGWYFKKEKKRMAVVKEEALRASGTVTGKPKIGGPFELIDTEGKTVTNEDFLGQYLLVYFGFTHCPDICPEELEKMTDVVDMLRVNPKIGKMITPIFITCDPQRDGIQEVKEYVNDFHPDLIGLTGTFDQIAKATKAYRVYFSAPPDVAPGEDYLVDHSIFFYLMDPHGEFMDAYSSEWSAGEVTLSVENHVKKYRAEGGAEGREAVLLQREERAHSNEAVQEEWRKTGLPLPSDALKGRISDLV